MLKNILPRKALEVIYLSLIRPLAEYAAPCFGKLNCVLSQSLESVQYQAGLIVSGLPKTTGYMTVLDELSWSPLEARRTALRCTMFYKILNSNAPVYLVEILNASYLVRRESQYSLRHEGSAKTIFDKHHWGNQEYMLSSFFPTCIVDWQQLAKSITDARSVINFKNKIQEGYHSPVRKHFHNKCRKDKKCLHN